MATPYANGGRSHRHTDQHTAGFREATSGGLARHASP